MDRKQATEYLLDLYYNGRSTYYDQGNRIRNYNDRIIRYLVKKGLVCQVGERLTKRGALCNVRDLTTMGRDQVKSILDGKTKRNVFWNALKRMTKR